MAFPKSAPLLLVGLLAFARPAAGQMFSYDADANRPLPARHIIFGLLQSNFTPRVAPVGSTKQLLDVAGPSFWARFRSGGLDVSAGYGAFDTAPNGRYELTTLAGTFGGAIPVSRWVSVPVELQTEFQIISPDSLPRQEDRFSASSVGGGIGLQTTISRNKQPTLELRYLAGLGYATQSDGARINGTRLTQTGDVWLRLFPARAGLALNYRFSWQQWNLTGDRLDLRTIQHAVGFGLIF